MGAEDELEVADVGSESDAEEPSEASEKPETPRRGKKDAWDKFQSVSSLVSGVLLAAVGYFLTGSVNQAIQRSQLQFNYVKEMQELLTKLDDPKTSFEDAKTTAVALAAFGSYAIPPLLNEIQSGQLNRPAAGEYGLTAVALADAATTCPAMAKVLGNRTAAYNWLTHRAAIRILGSANCQSAAAALARYQERLKSAASTSAGFDEYRATLAAEPTVTRETVDQLKAELEKTLRLLEQGRLKE